MHVKPPVLATSRSRGWLTLWHRWRRHTGEVKQAMHGMEGVRFCTRLKAVTARWPPRGARRRRIRDADDAVENRLRREQYVGRGSTNLLNIPESRFVIAHAEIATSFVR